ncbi:MAG: response regulator [Acidobacteria bacterium]|nr:response regulator [Acidobacteriota bacterium]
MLSGIAWCCVCHAQQPATYSFDHYTQEQGLENALVRAIAQDRTGFLWVGTRGGLFRFDGTRFQQMGPFNGSSRETVRDVHVDSSGGLWFATKLQLGKLDGPNLTLALLSGDTDGVRYALTSDSKNTVYIATSKGVLQYSGTGSPTPINPATQEPAWGVYVTPDDALWFGCGSEICRRDANGTRRYGAAQGVPQRHWTSYAADRKGNLWIRSDTHLLKLASGSSTFAEDTSWRVSRLTAPHTSSVGLQRNGRMIADRSGRLIIPTEEGLWIRDDSGHWEQIEESQGLPSNRVNCVFEDREGSLWIGHADLGLARWRGNGDWKGYNHRTGLSSNEVSAVVTSADRTLWVGTRLGLNRRDPVTGDWRLLNVKDGLTAPDVRALAATPNGFLWVGSRDNGLVRLDPRTMRTQLIVVRDQRPNQVNSLTVDDRGTLWLAAREGVFRSDQSSGSSLQFDRVFSAQLLPGEQIYRVRVDRQGNVWMAGTRGVLYQTKSGWARIGTAEGLRSQNLSFMAIAPDDSIWTGYGEYLGVSRLQWDNGRLRLEHFDRFNRLGSNDICFLETGANGKVWIGTDSGVDVFAGGQWRHFGTADGLIWHDIVFNAFHVDSDGVWIGTNRGLSHFKTSGALAWPGPPAVAITEVRFGGTAEHLNPVLKIAHDRSLMEARFSTLSFTRTSLTRFRYRLIGLHSHWVEASGRSASFPNLPSGNYLLEVEAGEQGVWNSDRASLRFEILAPWWQTGWFRALLAAAFCGLLYLVIRRHIGSLRRRRLELEAAVAERTRELALERDRTAQEKVKVEEQKREIERLLVESQEANRLKGEFLANVSHEIRTPMNGILGMTTLALQSPRDAEQRECLEDARQSAESLLVLLNDILDFSKIEANRLELEAIPFSISRTVEESVRTMSVPAQQKQLSLEFEIARDIPPLVIGDPTRLRQVLLNLVSNGIKFTADGHVRISVVRESDRNSSALLRFTVVDSGEGVPLEKQTAIFEAFRQADGSTTRRHGGTGLGLAICSRLVTLMGGEIGVKSKPGHGSEFSFTARFHIAAMVPVAGNGQGHELNRLAGAVNRGGQRPLRVLVAEDNAVNQKVLTRMLEKQGHEVDIAINGVQAAELTLRRRYDLVLMDVQMPEMDGLETTRLIRAREGSSGERLPILILTAHAMTGDRERCLDAGADGYLAKPVSLDRLIEAIGEVSGQPNRSVH